MDAEPENAERWKAKCCDQNSIHIFRVPHPPTFHKDNGRKISKFRQTLNWQFFLHCMTCFHIICQHHIVLYYMPWIQVKYFAYKARAYTNLTFEMMFSNISPPEHQKSLEIGILMFGCYNNKISLLRFYLLTLYMFKGGR